MGPATQWGRRSSDYKLQFRTNQDFPLVAGWEESRPSTRALRVRCGSLARDESVTSFTYPEASQGGVRRAVVAGKSSPLPG